MRNASVVLVALCIGLATGLTIPSSTSEISISTPPTTTSTATTKSSKRTEFKSSTIAAIYSVLPKNRNNIDEKDLYEHAIVKQNNQSERAFIYIKQKYKKPVRNRVFMVSADRPDIGLERNNIITSPLTGTDTPPCLPFVENAKLAPTYVEQGNTFFHEYEFTDKQDNMSPYFSEPDNDNSFRCNFNDEGKKVNEIEKRKPLLQISNRDDERRDYFELLKPPILRPVSRGSTKTKYEKTTKNDFRSISSPGIPYKDYYLKKYHLKSQYVPKSKLAEERPSDALKNYGFNRPYITHHSAFRNKEILPRADDVNFGGDFVHDDDSHNRGYDNSPDEDKLLDKYLKDTLEEQGSTVDKSNSNSNDCSYRDCILQSSKQYLNNGLLLRPECKCGRRLNLKQSDPFFAKDRSLREETKRNDTIAKSSNEMNYYEEILTDDSNNKLEDDIIRPPHKLNDTSPR